MGHLRDLIHSAGDEKPFDQVITSVDQVVRAIQTTAVNRHVNVSAIWSMPNQEFLTHVVTNVKPQFTALAKRLPVMTEATHGCSEVAGTEMSWDS